MRRVPLSMLTPSMRLGRAVCFGNSVLIREGTKELSQYIRRLERMGIESLLIEDRVCEDIEVVDMIQDKTRRQCKQTLQGSFERMGRQLAVDQGRLTETVETVLEEIIANTDVLISLSEIGDVQDNTLDHSVNTTVYGVCLGNALGYGKTSLAELAQGALMHDVGKIALDSKILFKPGSLTPEEFQHIKTHTNCGYELLRKNPGISEATRQVALCHHERMDGSGYPDGKMGDQLSEYSKIAAIVDVYEALTVDRCYRKAVSPQRALDILSAEAVSRLDFSLVASFMQNIAIYPNGSLVTLSDGSYAVVKNQNHSMPTRPVVRKLEMMNGEQYPGEEIDLMKVLNLTIAESDMTEIAKNFTFS